MDRLKWIGMLSSALLLVACAHGSRPAYSPVVSDKYSNSPVAVKRVYVAAIMPGEYKVKIAQPMVKQFAEVFRRHGVGVATEVQVDNPLSLGGYNLSRSKKFNPDVYVLIKVASSESGNYFHHSRLVVDVFDKKSTGLWRGKTTLLRADDVPKTSGQIADDVVRNLIEERVVSFVVSEEVVK